MEEKNVKKEKKNKLSKGEICFLVLLSAAFIILISMIGIGLFKYTIRIPREELKFYDEHGRSLD